MRSIATLLLLSSASVLGAAVRAPNTTISARDGDFAATCRTFTLFSGSNPSLDAACESEGGQFLLTTISLNECIANDNGVLACQAGGGYGGSCSTIGFSSGTVLHATCKNDAGKNVDAHLELNNCIGDHPSSEITTVTLVASSKRIRRIRYKVSRAQ
ncbi:Cyanovirin-N [Mycena leptocephala]|nr:Cyanovirin-N [Mycena leptocephala]